MCNSLRSNKIFKILQSEGNKQVLRPSVKQNDFIDAIANLNLEKLNKILFKKSMKRLVSLLKFI